MRGNGEVVAVFLLVVDTGRYAVSQVDLPRREVVILGVLVVGEDISLEAEPVTIVLGVALAALG